MSLQNTQTRAAQSTHIRGRRAIRTTQWPIDGRTCRWQTTANEKQSQTPKFLQKPETRTMRQNGEQHRKTMREKNYVYAAKLKQRLRLRRRGKELPHDKNESRYARDKQTKQCANRFSKQKAARKPFKWPANESMWKMSKWRIWQTRIQCSLSLAHIPAAAAYMGNSALLIENCKRRAFAFKPNPEKIW